MSTTGTLYPSSSVRSGIAAVDHYLDTGYDGVPGMSSRFAAAVCTGLMRIQGELGVSGPVAEIGTYEGRFFIALCKALGAGETALGMDLFDWPNPQVIDRFERNCLAHGVPPEQRITWKADSKILRPDEVLAKLAGRRPRFIHVDSEHTREVLTKDLELATAVLAPEGIMVLDDMLHPAYPMLAVAVHEYLERHPEMRMLAVIDRETIVAATKFALCHEAWCQRYEERLTADFKDYVWLMGADFHPHWCPVLSLDTRLARIPES